MNVKQKLLELAISVPIGVTKYFDCPQCGRQRKIGMTHKTDGIVYQCFAASCELKPGVIRDGLPISKQKVMDAILDRIVGKKKFIRPDHWINGFASEDSLKMAVKYNLLPAYHAGCYGTAYDPRLARQVFFYTDKDGKVVGANGRALTPNVRPKSYVYPNSEKTPWIAGDKPTAVLVEDAFSAVKVYNVGYTGISLSGTTIPLEYLDYLKGYKKLIIALDKDATIKSIQTKKLLDFVCNNVVILSLPKDLKDMTNDEARKIIPVD